MERPNLTLNDILIRDSVFTIGTVYSVKGREILVKVNKDKNLPHLFFHGRTVKNVSVGLSNFVKIDKGFTQIICKVEGEYLEEDKFQSGKKYSSERNKISRFLNVSVFGFYDDAGNFQYGIKEMPLIGGRCRLLSRNEFEKLHELAAPTDIKINMGTLVDEETQKIDVSVRKLFAGHIGIFGNTGSGKSNTLARMYTELFSIKEFGSDFRTKSKFVFIDFNGEYSTNRDDQILTKRKKVYRLRTRDDSGQKCPILKSEIEKVEMLSILLDATEKTQQPFLHRALDTDWFDDQNVGCAKEIESINRKIKIILGSKRPDFNISFLKKFVGNFEELGFKIMNSGKDIDTIRYHSQKYSFYFNPGGGDIYSDSNPDAFFGASGYFNVSLPPSCTLSDLKKIEYKIWDQYYYEILNGYITEEHIGPLMGRLKSRFSSLGKLVEVKQSIDSDNSCNIEVFDLKNVNLEFKKIIPLLICKTNYDAQKNRRDGESENSLHLIIDEAHNILSENSVRESESWKDYRLETFEEIIKEGRKFGVFLTIASQRPSDISPTIISQLHNYFIHRLMNENDLKSINRAVSYLDKLSFDSISNLAVGCCFIAGQMTQFPLSLQVKLLDPKKRPRSGTINLDKLWRK